MIAESIRQMIRTMKRTGGADAEIEVVLSPVTIAILKRANDRGLVEENGVYKFDGLSVAVEYDGPSVRTRIPPNPN